MDNISTKISSSQKIMLHEFERDLMLMMEEYWNPIDSDDYWDAITEASMLLIERFQTNNMPLNNFISNTIAAFLNSREEMLSEI